MPTDLRFVTPGVAVRDARTLLVAGLKSRLDTDAVAPWLPKGAAPLWSTMVESLGEGEDGDSTFTWLPGEPAARLVAAALPAAVSRHNTPTRAHALTAAVRKGLPGEGPAAVLVVLEDPVHARAAACAVARAFPLFSRKGGPDEVRPVSVAFVSEGLDDDALETAARAADAVRLAARLVDAPAAELHTDAFVAEAEAVAREVGAEVQVVRGPELDDQGFGGLWGVGKAATRSPALVVLTHAPPGAKRTVAWVGKGIVYDTGGLSLKDRASMPGMKTDMGGAAAVLAAFAAAARGGCRDRLHAVLCLAENAIGPEATRNDDVLTLYSGKTVEVNNTDAEGRLVLGDGVAYAARHLAPQVIVDLATLTGAQLVATGRRHAAVVSNDEDLEAAAVRAGRASGDLVHPLPYCPEFFRREFKSPVADMKNSVKDRANAQSSCAAQFVADHLGDFAGAWLHVDMAGPVGEEGRGTGFGVALLLELLEVR